MEVAPGVTLFIEGNTAYLKHRGQVVRQVAGIPIGFEADWMKEIPLTPFVSALLTDLLRPLDFGREDKLARRASAAGLPSPYFITQSSVNALEWKKGEYRISIVSRGWRKEFPMRVLVFRGSTVIHRFYGDNALHEAGLVRKALLS